MIFVEHLTVENGVIIFVEVNGGESLRKSYVETSASPSGSKVLSGKFRDRKSHKGFMEGQIAVGFRKCINQRITDHLDCDKVNGGGF